MNRKRLACVLLSHRYAKAFYEDSDAGEYYLRCRRCGKVRGRADVDGNRPAYYAWDMGVGG